MSEWHSGPPPSVGWWIASASEWTACIRWWNGKRWSVGASAYHDKHEAARRARRKADFPSALIKWQHRPANWPARSKT